ncbi:MAG: TetR/AcrR family transcriptional regulator [Shimia sp.]|uniref:TetR/AcrR family transcriptional regulator n=1 Tax=Shimia sp. TaxID=1954381 RepID=UPI001B098AE9|nr:TetR/AcrR family transcriptional regulator [Shimia sp.]MBO6899285.1 TetR/AcrR family transcriptional regulator [Shimia sp.]
MSEKSPDRRIARTQNALWSALQGLLQDQSWDDITIKMICDGADVARSSFYAHFDTKLDLLDMGFSSVLAELMPLAERNTGPSKHYVTTNWLVDHILENPGFFMRVSRSQSDLVLFTRFTKALENLLALELAAIGHTTPRTTVTFCIGGAFAVVRDHIETRAATAPATLKARLADQVRKALP